MESITRLQSQGLTWCQKYDEYGDIFFEANISYRAAPRQAGRLSLSFGVTDEHFSSCRQRRLVCLVNWKRNLALGGMAWVDIITLAAMVRVHIEWRHMRGDTDTGRTWTR